MSDYLPQYFDGNECPAAGLADLFAKELAAGGCLLLLDGLDEIVDAADRRAIVDKIENFIQRHAAGGPRGENRFVITSRIAGYRSAPVAGSGAPVAHYEVLEMDLTQIERFVTRWCHAVEEAQTPDLPVAARQATARREITGILDAVKANEGVRRLAANPLLLRTLALIHRTGAQLPQRRIELYKLAADTLARTWRPAQQVRMSVEVSKLLDETYLTRLLGKLAYWLHRHKPTGLATEAEVYARLGEEWAAILGRPWDEDDPDPLVLDEVKKFLAAVREHTGLFVERAPKRYGFMHLTFEEYYAARHLVARSRTRTQLIRRHLHDPRWEEPILLALGFVGLDAPEDAAELIESAILAQGEEAADLGFRPSAYEELLGRDYFFALRCLGDRIPVRPQTLTQLVNQTRQELVNPIGIAAFHHYQTLLGERIRALAGSIAAIILAEFLLLDLQNFNMLVRFRAAEHLGQLGSGLTVVVKALLTMLGDDDMAVRFRTAASLVQLGKGDSSVAEGLLSSLGSDNVLIRSQAAEILGQLGISDSAVLEGLLKALHDTDATVRGRAAESLGQLSDGDAAVIECLLVALYDEDANVRSRAAESLGQLGTNETVVIKGLLNALHDADVTVRGRAVESLGQLSGSAPVIVESLLAALYDSDADVRSRVADNMIQLGSSNPVVVQALLAALCDEDGNVRFRAATGLGQMSSDTSAVVKGLLTALHDSSEGVRFRAAASLVLLASRNSAALEGLLFALCDTDADIRSRAAESLGLLGSNDPAVTEGLLTALRDTDVDVRFNAATSLAQLNSDEPSIIDNLLAILHDDDIAVRSQAAISLGQIGKRTPHIIKGLLTALQDDNIVVRSSAAKSLVQLGNNSSELIPAWLEGLCESKVRSIRQDCAHLLGEYGQAETGLITTLLQGLLDKDDGLRTACSTALVRLAKRFPDVSPLIEQKLAAAIVDSQFEKRGNFVPRSGQDYAHEALWQVLT